MEAKTENRARAEELLAGIAEEHLPDAIAALERLAKKGAEKTAGTARASGGDAITIYTDGGCHGNPGPGGWGAVVIADGDARQISGGEEKTTNNRMELTAAISALSAVRNTERFAGRKIDIFTDSQYVKNGISSWINGWKKNGWLTSQKKPVLNKDLWQLLDELNSALAPSWNWVKGHAGVEFNEICDELCQKEIARFE